MTRREGKEWGRDRSEGRDGGVVNTGREGRRQRERESYIPREDREVCKQCWMNG